jgi:hypothetical protein
MRRVALYLACSLVLKIAHLVKYASCLCRAVFDVLTKQEGLF